MGFSPQRTSIPGSTQGSTPSPLPRWQSITVGQRDLAPMVIQSLGWPSYGRIFCRIWKIWWWEWNVMNMFILSKLQYDKLHVWDFDRNSLVRVFLFCRVWEAFGMFPLFVLLNMSWCACFVSVKWKPLVSELRCLHKKTQFEQWKKPRLLWLLYRGLYILPTYIGIIRSHCKDPY